MRRSEEYLGKSKGLSFNRKLASVVSEYFGVDTSKILHQGFYSAGNDSTEEDSSSNKGTSNFFKSMSNSIKNSLWEKKLITRELQGASAAGQ